MQNRAAKNCFSTRGFSSEEGDAMNLIIHTDGFEGYAKRSRERAKKLTRGERIEPSCGLTFESPLQMLEVLMVQRMRVVEVARTKPYSVTALAKKLRHDPKSVRRDVAKLEKYGMVRTRFEINPGHGRVKIVEPVAEKFVLKTSL
jgi:predicted transcriptional regulator